MNTTFRTRLYTAIYCTLGTAALCALSASVQAADQDDEAKLKRKLMICQNCR